MELVYFKTGTGNFGDDLNLWFWDEILPGWRGWSPETALVGVGTILARPLLPEGRRKLVLGSGVGYGEAPDVRANPDEWDIRWVRGPRSAAALGLPAETGLADPTVLLPDLGAFAGLGRGEDRIFVPHHGSLRSFDWETICDGTGLLPVSPTGDAREIVRRIATARSVVAESMHAAIIADAFRVPWRAVAIGRSFNSFKWRDWADSVGTDLDITRFFPYLRRVQSLVGRIRPADRNPPGRHPPSRNDGSPESSGLPRAVQSMLGSLARRTLKEVARLPCGMSRDELLDDRKRRIVEKLRTVERDYGSSGP